jgi:hypothetical protein
MKEKRMSTTENETPAMKIGRKLVSLCQAGKGLEAVDTLYDEKIVSIESQGSDEMPARMEGIQTVRGKSEWWYENNEIHHSTADGPFCGHREDQFVVRFDMDVTFKPSGLRSQMVEVGLYTIANDKIVQEEFLGQIE